MSGCYCAVLASPPCGWCDGPDRDPTPQPVDVPVPGLEIVREMELTHPPVAELPPAGDHFTLTPNPVSAVAQASLFDAPED